MAPDISLNEILQLLLPSELWHYVLYLILLFVLITLAQQPEGSITITIMLALVVVAIFIDKLEALPGHRCNFFTLLARISMFVVPLLTAGITQNPKSRGPAVVAAVLGLGYTFFLWALQMNNRAICAPLERDVSLLISAIFPLF